MAFQITATAPTAYQLQSLRSFGIGSDKTGNGSYTGQKDFETEDEAKEYLKSRAAMYNDEDPNGTDEKLIEKYKIIEQYGQLTLDAVTARIDVV